MLADFIKATGRGVALCLLIALPCWLLGKAFPIVGGPVFAILAGMLITFLLPDKSRLQKGITFTSKKILQYAVILLGFGLNLSEIAKVGAQSLPIIVSTIATALLIAYFVSRRLQMPDNVATLIGVGSSICGGSAIAAAAPVVGANDGEIAQSISVIFLFNVLAALIFPSLGMALGLSTDGFGLFAGTAVNDTSSVTAAAAAWDGLHTGANALDTATIVKLTRTLAIIPIVLGLAFLRGKKEGVSGGSVNFQQIFPMFIMYFVLASCVTTVCSLLGVPMAVFAPFKSLSKFFIIMAMAAIGLNTNIVKLVKNGGKPILLGACCWMGITAVSLMMQHILGIWWKKRRRLVFHVRKASSRLCS